MVYRMCQKQERINTNNMPLKKGKRNIGKNIKTEMAHGKPRKQAIAIALNVARGGKSRYGAMKQH